MWLVLSDLLSTTNASAPTITMGDFNAHLPDSYITDVPVSPYHSLFCKPPRGSPTGPTGARGHALACFFDPKTWCILNGCPYLHDYIYLTPYSHPISSSSPQPHAATFYSSPDFIILDTTALHMLTTA